jgi:phosphatidylserine/phosphatidylglycerophosphate/cardiolipin synthase-like enzyme
MAITLNFGGDRPMRFKNEKNPLKLHFITGTQTVLMSFDLDRKLIARENFLGFSIERRDQGKPNMTPVILNGSKHFASLMDDQTLSDPTVKFRSLVQSFFWKDYTADAGRKYVYTVKAMVGTLLSFKAKFESSIKVEMEPQQAGEHSIYFNYGVTGSQGYAKKKEFGNRKLSDLKGEVREKALDYLGRELWREGLVKFVRQAKKGDEIFGAFYEFEYDPFLDELKAAMDRGAQVQIVFSDKPDQSKDNRAAIRRTGLGMTNCHPRTKPNQPHNKFMVFCRGGQPKQVWTGSTNITIPGIFGHCNTGHWLKIPALAKKYKLYWDSLKDDPAMSDQAVVSDGIQPDADLRALPDGTYVFFSPRDKKTPRGAKPRQLQSYADLIDGAKELVCMIFPFNFDDIFKTVYGRDKDYLRLLIFEKMASAKRAPSNDRDLKVTAGAILETPVEQWVKEETAKKISNAGILYVHNKFFIIDPLGDDPIVGTGSANFSVPSILSNDENTLLIKGNARVADIYLTEFNRLFEHFWPRYLQKLHPKEKKGFSQPLDEEFTWFEAYYRKDSYGFRRKALFMNMKGAKQG